MAESDEDDYVFYGTSLQDEGETTAAAAGSKKDPALTRCARVCSSSASSSTQLKSATHTWHATQADTNRNNV